MNKLMLNIDALAVETFNTGGDAARPAGTVMGNQAPFMLATFELRCPTNYTCPDTR